MVSLNELNALRDFFNTGATKPYHFRKEQLLKLKTALQKYEQEIYAGLYADLKKSPEECWITENGFLLSEISHALKRLSDWMEPQKVKTNLVNFPSSSFVLHEPLGVVLIIGPWNYPLMLLLTPLVGAIAAGNCVVLKSSEHAPATSMIMKKIIESCFEKNYVLFVEGEGAKLVPAMMNDFIFDHVFFTGSTTIGRIIFQEAAKNLVPVTLELGGKSPCVVESDAAIEIAAKRIVLTKFSNAGQMCVAPDYLLVHSSKKKALINKMKQVLKNFFGENAATSYNYGKIINERQFDRIIKYMDDGNIVYGGRHDRTTLYIEPTILDDVPINSAVMKEEIFGPVLPVLSFETMKEAVSIIEKNKNPLSFYVFTSSHNIEKEWLDKVSFGSGCVNNASWQLTNPNLPFGGRGFSGSGQYHGKYSFDTFSHKKAILKTPTWFDPAIKYPPFKGKLKLFKWVVR